MPCCAQASLSPSGRPSPQVWQQQAAAYAAAASGGIGAVPEGSGDSTALVVATPGLQNAIGEYNCFLNVIIQCLWHCASFRGAFAATIIPRPDLTQARALALAALLFVMPSAPQHCRPLPCCSVLPANTS